MALGRTEGQLNELKNRVVESTSGTEPSIIEVLELWQQIFCDTFQQYHRLSTRLVQHEDRASALNLWHDYLMHVQLFLSETLPDDYICLNEYRNLCEVHQNVLTSQKSILSVNSNAISLNADPNLVKQFKQLSTLHNETLLRIIDRHAAIELRLKMWQQYKNDHSNLMIWLKEKEREKSRLQLRYIHLQRIPHMLQVIQNMLNQMEQAENDCANLRSQQAQIIQFSNDTALVTSMRMEIGSVVQRIDNLRASLETWKDFLQRITHLSDTYNQKVAELQSQFQKTQQIICATSKAIPQNISQNESTLSELRNQRIFINNLTPELDAITINQEELKECLYPSNIKTIRRTTHGLWQQQADIDQQLTHLINHIDERFTISDTFNVKYNRFMNWIDDIEHRLDDESCCILYDSEELLRRLEIDLQSELVLREREKEWLLLTGRELLTFYATSNETDKRHRFDIKKKLDTIVDRWERLKNLSKTRSNKIQELKMTMIRLEDRIAAIRAWLHNVEISLNKPIVFNAATSDALEKVIQEHDTLQRSIEKESGSVGEVLNLCEMVLSDIGTWKAYIDTIALSTAIETLDQRWKYTCKASMDRKQKIHTIWSLLLEALGLTNELIPWMNDQEKELNELEIGLDKLNKHQTEQRINAIENKIREIEVRQPQFTALSQLYCKLVKHNGIDPSNMQVLTNPCKLLLNRYEQLLPQALDILGKLNMDIKLHQKFINLHGKSVVELTRLDAELTKAEHLSQSDPDGKLQTIQVLEHELKLCENDLASADLLGLDIMKKSDRNDVDTIQIMIDEYQVLWKDVITRLTNMKTKLTTQLKQAKQIETAELCRSEIDSAVQVNTLPSLHRSTSITAKDAYVYELQAALKECQENLDQLETEINNPQRKPGSQVVQKLCSNCQSSVELLHHLSNLLITECFCSDEEAATSEVSNISSRYDALMAIWKSKERQLENRYIISVQSIYFFISLFFILHFGFFLLTFAFWFILRIMGTIVSFNFLIYDIL